MWEPLECVGPLARQTLRLGDLSGRHLGGHAAYITCDEFERNVKAIANTMTGMSGGAPARRERPGKVMLLLPRFLRRWPLRPQPAGTTAASSVAITAMAQRMNHGDKRCISVSGWSTTRGDRQGGVVRFLSRQR